MATQAKLRRTEMDTKNEVEVGWGEGARWSGVEMEQDDRMRAKQFKFERVIFRELQIQIYFFDKKDVFNFFGGKRRL